MTTLVFAMRAVALAGVAPGEGAAATHGHSLVAHTSMDARGAIEHFFSQPVVALGRRLRGRNSLSRDRSLCGCGSPCPLSLRRWGYSGLSVEGGTGVGIGG